MVSHTPYDYSALTTMILGFIVQERYSTLWFLAALFFCELFFWVIDTYIKEAVPKYIICLLLGVIFILYDSYFAGYGTYSTWITNAVLAKPLPWNIDVAFISLIFFGFGNLLKRYDVFHRFFNTKKKIAGYGLLFLALAVSIFLFSYLNGYKTLEMWGGYYGIFPLTISSALIMSMDILLLSKLMTKSRLLPFIGQNTFVIFAFHQMIGLNIGLKIVSQYSINVPTVSGAVFTLLILYSSAIICSLIFGFGLHFLHLDFAVGKK